MIKKTDVILYPAGAYGNLINWCYSYFSGHLDSILLDMNEKGSVHNNFANSNRFLTSWIELKNYVESDIEYPVIQVHDTVVSQHSKEKLQRDDWFDTLLSDVEYLSNNFRSVLYIYPTESSISWWMNNLFYKIQPFSDLPKIGITNIEEFFKEQNFSDREINAMKCTGVERLKSIIDIVVDKKSLEKWNHQNISEFSLWELRELCSYFLYDSYHSKLPTDQQLSTLQNFNNVKFVKLDQLRDNFVDSLASMMDFFMLASTKSELSLIHQQWLPKQEHIYKDQFILDIINSIVGSYDLDYSKFGLTFIDEVFIQRKLSNIKIELRCYELNELPSNTLNLKKLIVNE